MQMTPGLPPCELTLPHSPEQNFLIGPSLALASFLVDSLYLLCWLGALILISSSLLVLVIFSPTPQTTFQNSMSVAIFYAVYRLGIIIVFKKGRSRLVSMCLRIIKGLTLSRESDVSVKLTSQALQLQTEETRLVLNWSQVESITSDGEGYLLELLEKPGVYLAQAELPPEWQHAFAKQKLE